MHLPRRRLGRTGLWVAPVGMGTCQLRLRPRERALATLRAACQAGINLFHTSPDYEGALELTLEAVRFAAERPTILHQGYGPMPHFRHLYQQALASEPGGTLKLFGIACVEDREAVGENVFGAGGMIEFLQAEKAVGRLGGIFCTTHAGAKSMRQYLEMGVFDAAMIAYNPLGFHLLTYNGAGQREFENMEQIREEIFPLAQRLDIGLMIMKPLAGGLLARGKAFPPAGDVRPELPWSARQVLEWILKEPAVSCVVPGMADPAEVWENTTPSPTGVEMAAGLGEMRRTICSRCGICDTLCSRNLPVSWLFRDGYIQMFPSETFESPAEMRIEQLHPAAETACTNCANRTCRCPQGLDIPFELPRLHETWKESRARFAAGDWKLAAEVEVIEARIPRRLAGEVVAIHVRNRSNEVWITGEGLLQGPWGDLRAPLNHRVHPNETTHLIWEMPFGDAAAHGAVALGWNGGKAITIGHWRDEP